MSTNPTDMLALIPVRDESIRLALTDIEQKLSAWAAALAECSYAPRAEAEPAIDRQASPTPSATKAPEIEKAVESASKSATQAVEEPPAAQETEASPVQVEEAVGGAAEEVAYETDEDALTETPVSRHANPDDDDAVLEGLSPESAKAIKVQWRLLEGSKALRQLVEEHKARLARGDGSKDGKKSWWSRGKG